MGFETASERACAPGRSDLSLVPYAYPRPVVPLPGQARPFASCWFPDASSQLPGHSWQCVQGPSGACRMWSEGQRLKRWRASLSPGGRVVGGQKPGCSACERLPRAGPSLPVTALGQRARSSPEKGGRAGRSVCSSLSRAPVSPSPRATPCQQHAHIRGVPGPWLGQTRVHPGFASSCEFP